MWMTDCSFKLSEDRVETAFKKSLLDHFIAIYKLRNELITGQIEDARASVDPLKAIVEHLSPRESRENNPNQMAEFCSIVGQRFAHEVVSTLRLWRKITKVCSFSEVSNSLLMWAHYADNHRGFCVEYDLETHADSPFCKSICPVIYSKELYDLTPYAEKLVAQSREGFNSTFSLLGILHKFDGWSYKKEWRLVLINPNVTEDHTFKAPTPAAVYFGSKTPPANRDELMNLCNKNKIEVRQMRLAKDRFELFTEST